MRRYNNRIHLHLIDCYEQNWLTRRCGRYTIRPRIATRANYVQRSFLSFLCFNHSLPTFFSWCQFWFLCGGAKFGAYLLLERHPNNLILLIINNLIIIIVLVDYLSRCLLAACFDTNYIIFRNAEIVFKTFFFKILEEQIYVMENWTIFLKYVLLFLLNEIFKIN